MAFSGASCSAQAISAFSSCFANGGYTQSIQQYLMKGFPSATKDHVKKLIEEVLQSAGIEQPEVLATLSSRILAGGKEHGVEALGQARSGR